MPRPNPPPTPGSSSDLRGKEGSYNAAPAFNLPPTAFQDADRASVSSSTPSNNGSDSSYKPVSPHSGETSRKKPTAAAPMESGSGRVITKDDFTLPPPPTRSRKIIQMKPEVEAAAQAPTAAKTPAAAGGKRKSNAGTTAAGRKIARKTAHSLIERRRRSKMNEEFGVLKDMIPACKGQEMHKLAILSASIEYLRYLEQCVQDLQAQTNSPRPRPPPSTISQSLPDEEDSDEEMADDVDQDPPAATSGTGNSTPVTSTLEKTSSLISLPSLSQITTTSTTSPSLFPSSTGPTAGRHYSVSSAAGSQASYSPYFHSNQTSPAFGPQLHHIPPYNPPSGHFGIGSPALKPMDSTQQLRQIAEGATELSEKRMGGGRRQEQDLDQEATAALLMLNHDRRQWRPAAGPSPNEGSDSRRPSTVGSNGNGSGSGSGNGNGNGMSVRDLLSG